MIGSENGLRTSQKNHHEKRCDNLSHLFSALPQSFWNCPGRCCLLLAAQQLWCGCCWNIAAEMSCSWTQLFMHGQVIFSTLMYYAERNNPDPEMVRPWGPHSAIWNNWDRLRCILWFLSGWSLLKRVNFNAAWLKVIKIWMCGAFCANVFLSTCILSDMRQKLFLFGVEWNFWTQLYFFLVGPLDIDWCRSMYLIESLGIFLLSAGTWCDVSELGSPEIALNELSHDPWLKNHSIYIVYYILSLCAHMFSS